MNNKELSILQLPESEPFAVGIDIPVSSPSFALQKLENFTLLFIHKGSAQVELDFRTYNLHPDHHIGLAADLHFQCLKASPDFTVSYITFVRDILLEITTYFDPSFFAFLKQYPLSLNLPQERVEGNRRMMEFIYNIYGKRAYFPGTNIQELPAKLPDGYL